MVRSSGFAHPARTPARGRSRAAFQPKRGGAKSRQTTSAGIGASRVVTVDGASGHGDSRQRVELSRHIRRTSISNARYRATIRERRVIRKAAQFLMIFVVRAYQVVLGPMLPPACRYTPS